MAVQDSSLAIRCLTQDPGVRMNKWKSGAGGDNNTNVYGKYRKTTKVRSASWDSGLVYEPLKRLSETRISSVSRTEAQRFD